MSIYNLYLRYFQIIKLKTCQKFNFIITLIIIRRAKYRDEQINYFCGNLTASQNWYKTKYPVIFLPRLVDIHPWYSGLYSSEKDCKSRTTNLRDTLLGTNQYEIKEEEKKKIIALGHFLISFFDVFFNQLLYILPSLAQNTVKVYLITSFLKLCRTVKYVMYIVTRI